MPGFKAPRSARCRIIGTLMWSLLLIAFAMAMPMQQPGDLDAVMQRASAYVAQYETALGNLIATEEYLQTWTNGRNARIAQRRTLSDVLLIQVGSEWSALRKVTRVDGSKLKTDEKGFAEAFEDSPANNSKRLLQMKTESTQYNLGNILREINLSTFALKVLRQTEIERFNFEKSRSEKINGVSTWAVHFAERGLQTLVRGEHGERLYSTGTLWIDPLTGRVLKTEFIVENPFADPPVKARTVVNYTRGKATDLLVPKSMLEHYESRGTSIDCLADYSDFRRFEVDVKFDFGPTKPQ